MSKKQKTYTAEFKAEAIKALKDVEPEQFTDPVFVLDRRKLYKSKYGTSEDY